MELVAKKSYLKIYTTTDLFHFDLILLISWATLSGMLGETFQLSLEIIQSTMF